MTKRDNVYVTLMTYCKVNLQCDDVKLQLRYARERGKAYSEWFINGKNSGLQVTELYKSLKDKYKSIKVLWKHR